MICKNINSNMNLSIEKTIKIAYSLGTKLKHGNGTSCTNQILYIMQNILKESKT